MVDTHARDLTVPPGASTGGDAFWDRYLRHYDVLTRAAPYREVVDRVASLCDPGPGAVILDAGAGTGNLVAALRRGGAGVVALDTNEPSLRRARSKAPGSWCVRATLEATLPFKDESFDAVATVNVLYTLSEAGRARCLAEFRRVVKRAGRLVLATPVEGASPVRVYLEAVRRLLVDEGPMRGAARVARFLPEAALILAYNARITRRERRGAYHFFRKDELAAAVEAAGFRVEGLERTYADQAWLCWARSAS